MLKARIVPTLLWKDVGLVKGVGFDSWRRIDTVLPAIKVYNLREVDELIVLDISATSQAREPDYESIADFTEECFVPITIGGGVRTVDQMKRILRAGADKIAINTALYENPNLLSEGADRFGSQCMVASIDVKREENGQLSCYSHCGKVLQKRDAVDWACELEKRGAGEVLVTSIQRDGTMQGYDLDMIRAFSERVSIPVIASGGAGCYEDLYQAIHMGGASAVAAASMYHFTQQTPREARQYLRERGIPVRNASIRRDQ